MLINARGLEPGAVIDADVCIVGAGPAGLAVATEFVGSGLKVAVLESGDIKSDPKASELATPARGFKHGNMRVLESNRQIGGNSCVWNIQSDKAARTVRFAPYSEGDFLPKPWRDGVGWPFPRRDLDAYYDRALRFVGQKGIGFNLAEWETDAAKRLPLQSNRVETAVFQFPDASVISDRRRDEVIASSNVTIYTYATAQSLIVAAGGRRVEGVCGVSAPDRKIEFRAREVILCANGFSTPQLLLNSTDVSPNGVGNEHDNVGRYYMNHPLVDGGDFIPANKEMFSKMALYDLRTVRDTAILGYFHMTADAIRTENLLNICFMLFPAEKGYRENSRMSERQQYGAYCALQVRDALKYGRAIRFDQIGAAIIGFDGLIKIGLDRVINRRQMLRWNLGRGGWSNMPDLTAHYDRFGIVHLIEQAAHRDNRVYLGNERDALGARKFTIDWKLHDEDVEAVQRAQAIFAEEVKKSGLGTYEPLKNKDGGIEVISASTGHVMGATRMHEDPKQGVVDANCKVHGVDNLHIASSSVFPSGGYANPTFTIIALAIRLADRVKAIQSARTAA